MPSSRDKRLQKVYGITEQQWNQMFDRQNGFCPICDKEIPKPDNAHGKRAAAVDHDHKTGRVRGLVHFRCNKFYIAGNTTLTAMKLVDYLSSTFDGRNI